MRNYRLFLFQILIICCFPLSIPAENDDLLIETCFNKNTVHVGQEIEYELNIKWRGNPTDYEIVLDGIGFVGLTLTAAESFTSSRASPDGYFTKKIIYRMRAEQEGKAKVAGTEVKLLRKTDGTIISRQIPVLEIDVLPVGKKLWDKNLGPRRLSAILLFLISFISLVAAGYLFVKNNKRKAKKQKTTMDTLQNYEQLEKNIKNLSPLLYEGDFKSYLTEVEKLLIKFLEEINNKPIKTLSLTFIEQMKQERLLPPQWWAVLEEFHHKCELLKFGGEKISRRDIDNLTDSLLSAFKIGTSQIDK